MRVERLKIEGFRNLKKATLDFSPKTPFVAFIGSNGQGKTNVLETLFLLGISKSFRTGEGEEMIGFGQEFFSIKGTVDRDGEPHVAEVILTLNPPKKTLKANGVVKKASEFIGSVGIVFFSPDDLGMIHQAPRLRRRYLDLLLSQLDRDYLENALRYQSALRQRNSLLRQIRGGHAQESELEFWDHELARSGAVLVAKRMGAMSQIGAFSIPYYKVATGTGDELALEYLPSGTAIPTIEALTELFGNNHSRDIAMGSTQSGPHRDDLRFLCNGHDLASFGSRGEWRSLVLTLKFAEIELLRAKNGTSPILLLDDVFSELDDRRQRNLFSSISGCQTFMTTTHREFLNVIQAPIQIFTVESGTILESISG